MNAEYQKFNPFRIPDWRWARVLQLAEDRNKRTSWRHDDKYIKAGRLFILKYRKADEAARYALFADNPGLYYAYQIMEQADDEVSCVIQARLLAAQSFQEIADSMATLPETVEWYEALFFNVADRVQDKTKHKDWVVKTILGPAFAAGVTDRTYDLTAKLFGYFAGPYVLNSILHKITVNEIPTDLEQMNKFWDDQMSTTLRRRSAEAALNFEVNKFNVMQLFETHIRLLELENSSNKSGELKTDYEKQVQALLLDLNWQVGVEALEDTSALNRYTSVSAELRADQMLAITSGKEDPELFDKMSKLKLPDPVPKLEKK